MINWSLSALSNLLNVTCSTPDAEFTGISIDTRTLVPGNLFIAICGEKFDGHQFINEAVQKGAKAILVNQPNESSVPQLVVSDTILAFGKISAAWRARFSLPIAGVTGSNGKTTLKNMIAAIQSAACHSTDSVLATLGNLNNGIGVPIMLARLNAQHRYGVIEMGMNHFGEIAYLTQLVKPEVAIINNAAESHLEGVNDVAGVAKAKGEIFLGLNKDGTAVLNRDDAFFEYWSSLVPNHKQISFGLDNPADVKATILSDQTIVIHTAKGDISVKLALLGQHNIRNALGATAVALAMNIDLNAIKMGLENVKPAHGRMQQYVLKDEIRVIDDTYNANPFSLQAAVNTLTTFPGKKILVIGDMKELGADAEQLHFEAGEKIRIAGIDHLLTLGELSAATSAAYGNGAQHFVEAAPLIKALQPLLKPNTTLLIKGSRSMRMERIVAEIIPENRLEQAH